MSGHVLGRNSDGPEVEHSRLRRWSVLRGINKLPNFCPLFVELRHVLLAEALINLELFLSVLLVSGVNIRLPQPIVRVGKIRDPLNSLQILRNGLCILLLVGVKISQLLMRLSKARIENNGLL